MGFFSFGISFWADSRYALRQCRRNTVLPFRGAICIICSLCPVFAVCIASFIFPAATAALVPCYLCGLSPVCATFRLCAQSAPAWAVRAGGSDGTDRGRHRARPSRFRARSPGLVPRIASYPSPFAYFKATSLFQLTPCR